ncbi:nicotinamide riboside transporter PnuC [Paenibacillus oceani]|nr:nicotinamide riboside transporter PnuC [Paenibacillus oceani]
MSKTMNNVLQAVGLVIGMALIGYTSSTVLEAAASITGLLSVWLTARANIWAWPTGLVSVVCFFYIFMDVKLYADMTLQVFFFVLSIYGWVVWLSGRGNAKVRPTTRMTGRLAIVLIVFLIAATAGWGYALDGYTDAAVPYLDAFIAVLSLIAQYLLSRKVLESWYGWIAVDVLSIGMYAYKGLDAVATLYVIFLGIAIYGLVGWRREYTALYGKTQPPTPTQGEGGGIRV